MYLSIFLITIKRISLIPFLLCAFTIFHLFANISHAESHVDSSRQNPTSDWLPKDIDWTSVEKITIRLQDDLYVPEDVSLKINKPYKLIFDNESKTKTHDLYNIDFFHAFVLERILLDRELIVTPHIHTLKLRPQGKIELYMVPIKAGEYDVYCTIPGHREEGMEGVFIFN